MQKINNIKSIMVHGKRWFDKVNGNTYCSAEIYFDGNLVAEVPFTYGYGNFYMQAALQELEKNNLIQVGKYDNGVSKENLYSFCEKNNIKLVDIVEDTLKRNLLKKRTLKGG